ncbi:MAG TPA: hypothetical protein P5340_05390 [Defluviicoccus sp.]|nr:hypothetical protein [Defluviicoccus sp.]
MVTTPRAPGVCWVEGRKDAFEWPGAVEIDRTDDGGWRLMRIPRLAEFGDDSGMHVYAPAEVSDFLASRERQYRETGNPAFVWLAYGYCRTSGVPLPLWVLGYFDRCYERIEHAVFRHEAKGEPSASITASIGAIFGFKSGRGRGNWISQISSTMSAVVQTKLFRRGDRHRRSGLAPGRMLEIGRDVDEAGGKQYWAVEAIAAEHGISIGTVRKCHRAYKKAAGSNGG